MTSLATSAVASPLAAPAPRAERPLRILFVVSAHNSLSQRVFVALTDLGHDVSVEVVDSQCGDRGGGGAARARADRLPDAQVDHPGVRLERHRCLIVHPGPRGDRGPSSLDWAIELEMAEWGVTVLEATGEVDGGDVWASRTFRTREAGKSSLYRHEVRRAAIEAVVDAVTAVAAGGRVARAGRLRRSERDRPPAPVDPAARPRDRLELRLDRDRDPPHPRRRGPPGRARPDRGDRVPSLRRPPRGRAARRARRDRRAAPRRDLPRDRRRSRLDQPPEAARPLQASRDARARDRRTPRSTSRSCPRRCTRRRSPRRRSARSPTRSTAASATCTSTSTTAR